MDGGLKHFVACGPLKIALGRCKAPKGEFQLFWVTSAMSPWKNPQISWCPNTTHLKPYSFSFPQWLFPPLSSSSLMPKQQLFGELSLFVVRAKDEKKDPAPSSDTHELAEKTPHYQDRLPRNNPVHYPSSNLSLFLEHLSVQNGIFWAIGKI